MPMQETGFRPCQCSRCLYCVLQKTEHWTSPHAGLSGVSVRFSVQNTTWSCRERVVLRLGVCGEMETGRTCGSGEFRGSIVGLERGWPGKESIGLLRGEGGLSMYVRVTEIQAEADECLQMISSCQSGIMTKQ